MLNFCGSVFAVFITHLFAKKVKKNYTRKVDTYLDTVPSLLTEHVAKGVYFGTTLHQYRLIKWNLQVHTNS